MGGRVVSDPPSSTKGGGGDQSPAPHFAYTQKFKDVFPYYLAIGMTYEQFWEQDCELVKYYRKAAQIKQELRNQDAWLHGMYIYEALVDVAPSFRAMGAKKPMPYRKEPFDLNLRQDKKTVREKEQKSDDKAKAFMEAFSISNNKKFQSEGGGVDG